jgi:hypothetical protein
MSEKTLHRAVCDYLRMQYPDVMFNSDMSGAMKLTIGQAVQIKALRSNRGYPDIMIFEARDIWHGLLIELKTEGTKLTKRNDDPATPHIREQAECINALIDRKYAAFFAVGFDQAKEIIDNYLKSQ